MSVSSSPRASQPELLKIRLFNHQLTSLYEMENMEQLDSDIHKSVGFRRETVVESRLGIMGDIPGYGKSYSMVALILNDRMPCPPLFPVVEMESYRCGLAKRIVTTLHETINCSLVLVGPSLIAQWKEYFAQTPLRVKVVISNKNIDEIDTSQLDVVIVIPSMFNNLVRSPKYARKFWKRFVYDEPVSVHVVSMTFVNACFYWMITASYMDLLTGKCCRSGMLKAIFGQNTEMFSVVKNCKHYLLESYKMPTVVTVMHTCYSPNVAQVLQGFVSPNTASLISAGDISGAVAALGAENFSGNIVDFVSSRFTDAITMYTAKLTAIEGKVIKNDKDASTIANYKSHIEENIRKRDTLRERFELMLKDNDCPICVDKLNEPIMVPCCQNIFCGQCLLTWLKDHASCPYCRGDFDKKHLVHIESKPSSEAAPSAAKEKLLTKPETVVKIVNEILQKPEGRIIVYSMSDKTFSVLAKFLDDHCLRYGILKGCPSTRQRILNSYMDGSIQILLLNSSYNAAGINLQQTTDIIMYHGMDSSTIEQVVGRAMRVGRNVGDLRLHMLEESGNNEQEEPSSLPAGSSAQHAAGPDIDDLVAIEAAMASLGYSPEEIASYSASHQ